MANDLVVRLLMKTGNFDNNIRQSAAKVQQYQKTVDGASRGVGNFTKQLGLNVSSVTKFIGGMGAAAAAGATLSKMFKANDELGDKFRTTLNVVSDVSDAFFKGNLSNWDELIERSKEATKAIDDYQTYAPMVTELMRGITAEYNMELAKAKDINIAEGERLQHLARAKQLIEEQNKMQVTLLRLQGKQAQAKVNLEWAKMGGKGELNMETLKTFVGLAVKDGYNVESYLNDPKVRAEYEKAKKGYKTGGGSFVQGGSGQFGGSMNYVEEIRHTPEQQSIINKYEGLQRLNKLLNDEEGGQAVVEALGYLAAIKESEAQKAQEQTAASRVEGRLGKDNKEKETEANKNAIGIFADWDKEALGWIQSAEKNGVKFELKMDADFSWLSLLGDWKETVKEAGEEASKSMKDSFATIKNAAINANDEINQSFQNSAEEEKKAQEARLNAYISTTQSIGSMFGAMSALMEEGSEEAKAMAMMEIVANSAAGIAAAVKAGAGQPFPANLAAIASGIAAVMAGIAQAKQVLSSGSFETGGIVGGTSYHGDRLTANVNSGEMILNGRQQRNLFNMINGGRAQGGEVKFRISGTDLIGTLNNQSRKNKILR